MTASTPDAPVEVGAGAFIESVPTPAEAATTDAAREALAERRGAAKALRAAAACLDNDDDIAAWLRARAAVLAGPDTTTEGDPR